VNPADGMALRRILLIRPAASARRPRAPRRSGRAWAHAVELRDRSGTRGRAPRAQEFLARSTRSRAIQASRRRGPRWSSANGLPEQLPARPRPRPRRVENLRELLAGAEDFAAANAGRPADERSAIELFLDQVALVSDLDAWESRSDRVSMMTAHNAKGLEFPVVFLVGLEEGLLPHVASTRDAGHRGGAALCYVGMTRAMERLTLTCASERRRYGSRTFSVPSRFLSEIPRELVVGGLAREEARERTRAHEGGRTLDHSFGQEAPAQADGLRSGLRVRHPIFGEGTVIAVRGAGQAQKLDIRFDRVGVKTVLVRFANLEAV
jgi:DNA helicase-2/ATP-dependent DNA helicase PcrA